MQNIFKQGQQQLNQAHYTKLAEDKRALDEKIRREQAARANRASMFSAGGAVVGIVAAAAIVGTGGGAAPLVAGAMIGSGVGTAAAGATEE